MRLCWKPFVLAIAAAFVFAPAAQASPRSKHSVSYRHAGGMSHHSFIRGIGNSRAHGVSRRHGTGFADLVGDPGGGLGFYSLPARYRVGAWRYRVRHQRPPWQNPVLFAIAADAVRYNDWIVTNQGYRYGVFNPNDGVGTPFFGGYYGPAGDDDEPSPPPFGRPYPK